MTAALPLDTGDAALVELSALRREIVPLRRVADRAAYLTGPDECVQRDCDHRPGGCPEVVECHATFGDVIARDGLEHIVADLLDALGRAVEAGEAIDGTELVERLVAEVGALAHQLDEVIGGDAVLDRPLYRTIGELADRS